MVASRWDSPFHCRQSKYALLSLGSYRTFHVANYDRAFRFGRSILTARNSSGPLSRRLLRTAWSSALAVASVSLSIVLPANSRALPFVPWRRIGSSLFALVLAFRVKPISTSRRIASERDTLLVAAQASRLATVVGSSRAGIVSL